MDTSPFANPYSPSPVVHIQYHLILSYYFAAMVVGVCRLDLRIHDVNSLKLKRQILRKIIDRTKNKFNVAIAEVGDNDLWQRAKVGFAVVGNDGRHVNSMMETITTFIEDLNIAEIIDTEGELMHY